MLRREILLRDNAVGWSSEAREIRVQEKGFGYELGSDSLSTTRRNRERKVERVSGVVNRHNALPWVCESCNVIGSSITVFS